MLPAAEPGRGEDPRVGAQLFEASADADCTVGEAQVRERSRAESGHELRS